MSEPVLRMTGITKRFPGVLANDGIDFELRKGEIHALLGENGAGKTTLMKILYGLYQADAGRIEIHGRPVRITSPGEAIKCGVGMVHQHFMLIPPFTVAENIVLGTEPVRRRVRLDLNRAVQRVEELSRRYGLKVNPLARVEGISVGMQQRVEIIKALYREVDILVLDEPTAVLTPQEVGELKEIMRHLVAQGKSIIFITHKLREVSSIADRVTVIRRGRVVGTRDTAGTNARELANMMVGHEVELVVAKKPADPGAIVLEMQNVHALNNRRLPALRGVNLTVRAGEILGIAGIEGNGQTELVEVLTGLRRCTAGRILLHGKPVTNLSPRRIAERRVAHVPEDRQNRGLVLEFSVAENMILESYYKKPFASGIRLLWPQVHAYARRLIGEFDIRTPGDEVEAASLSGGNQQKLILARELSRDPELLVIAQPTRGLDVGAIEFVHRRLIEARDAGKAVLLLSLELEEIMALSDRIAVIYEGEIVGQLTPAEASEEKLGLMMAGAAKMAPVS
ncbi:MAG: ABC transporter ATP-binding protein [Bacteroidota bacterium]